MELRLEAPDWKMPVPVIETERLRLRLPRAEDLQSSLALWREPEVYRHITKKPSTEMESWARLMRYAGHWAWLGHGFFAVEEKSTGQYVGEVGSGDFRRDIDAPRMKGVPEIGWVLHPKVHGRGFATEALRAFLKWLDTEFPRIAFWHAKR